jgi:hypothetical protein
MVAVAQYIPDDPEEQQSVLAVLQEHPELQEVILSASAKARDIFSDVRITLDTRRYDEWDAPVRMLFLVDDPWPAFQEASRRFIRWLSRDAKYDDELILIMPVWNGPLESARR